jgi:hypothetical protein
MTPKSSVVRLSSLLAAAAMCVLPSNIAQAQGRSRGGNPQTGSAVSRDAPQPSPAPAAQPERSAPPPQQSGQAQPRNEGSRDRGDNAQVGRVVPRGNVRGGGVYGGPAIRNYYYYPQRYYPYGYGAFGLGYFYYDPYTWYGPSAYYGGYPGGYSGYYPDPYFDVGELRVDVSPNSGDVYVDGYFAGRVDDFDGVFQALKLAAGPHHIQVVAPGYAPLDFDVRIDPDHKITYRASMMHATP